MSMTGSLMGYENNNEVNQAKCKKPLKPLSVVTSVNAAGVTTTNAKSRSKARASLSRKREPCMRGHVNSLWSVWYGILAVSFQAYIAVRCTKRFIAYLSLPWPADAPPPKFELHACLVLAGTGVLLLPILLAAAFLKLGNLANDGIKLGRHLSSCSRDPPSSLLNNSAESGLANNLWRHGGPTAAFVHLCTAMCFLLPSLLMEARLIHAGFLPKEAIWRTDLDWVVTHHDRLVVLSFMEPPENLTLPTTHSRVTSIPFQDLEDLQDLDNSTGMTMTTLASSTDITENSETIFPSTKLSAILLPSRAQDLTDLPEDITTMATSTATLATTRKPTPKMNARNAPERRNRSRQRSSGRAQTTHRPGQSFAGNMTGHSLPLTFNSLADLDRPEYLNVEIRADEDYGPITLEYLNYAMALCVYSVRYPAIFWASNKALGTIFSIQLVANSAQSLLAYAGMSILYKVQVMGPLKVLPFLRHRSVPTANAISSFFGDRFFLLNPHVTLAIFALSSLLVLCSSMVMYLYAYGRFTAFLDQERERRVITTKGGKDDSGWGFMTHSAALCLFLAIAICNAPLLYDYTVVYRGSLDGVILACIIGTVFHLLLWLLLWIFLTVKQKWTFKLRVTIGRATVRSARSVKLVTDVDLASARGDEDGTSTPLLVVGNGRTYTVAETSPKKAIMSVIQKAAMERKARSHGGNSVDFVDGESTNDDEQIYWLRPKLRPSPVQSSNENNCEQPGEKGWLNKKLKQKVTFNDLPSTSGSRNKGKTRRGVADGGPDDDGDYATLRELPLVTSLDPTDDSTSEENKPRGRWPVPRRNGIPIYTDLLECVNDDQVTYYASGSRDLQPSEGDPSPLLTPDPLSDPNLEMPLPLPPPTPTSAPVNDVAPGVPASTNSQLISGQTPRCLRRADSGMPHEELTPRSDSSNSPPLDAGGGSNGHNSNTSSHSETSSGVHSNASNASNASQGSSSHRRANSVEDLTNEPREEPQWRSCSLQRGTQPPTSNGKFAVTVNTVRVAAAQNNSLYVNHMPLYNGVSDRVAGCPAVILENPNESTVVIRRKTSRPKLAEPLDPNAEPFGRSTNMRMTSFTENSDLRAIQASSATLPHYPTQPVVTYPHCSTMPLPHATHIIAGTSMNGSSGSCGSVPKHTTPQPPSTTSSVQGTVPVHTTLPSHHNGVRLLLHGGSNPFVKRFPPVQVHTQPWALSGGHHTFPQLPANGKLVPPGQIRQTDRDSANFSMASSGDSDTCLPH